jgi:hypothetical protein
MTTTVTTPLLTQPISPAFLDQLLIAAGITDFRAGDLVASQAGQSPILTAPRQLTAAEKSALSAAFAASLLQFADQ